MTTEPKHRAFTAEDVRAAYEAGTADGRRAGPSGAHRWHTRSAEPWHPDNPANRVTEPEWRTDAPEVGRWVETRDEWRWFVSSEYWAEAIEGDAKMSPDTDAWRYMDPPTTTTTEDNE